MNVKNKLFIAGAGCGKTTFIIENALKIKDKKVLITTYTDNNECSIKNKIIEKNGFIPNNIKVQTWFSFLIQHGAKPYLACWFKDIDNINGLSFVQGYNKNHPAYINNLKTVIFQKIIKYIPSYYQNLYLGAMNYLKIKLLLD